ncbi:MAG: hypothetical protein KDC34_17095, partial [Saprospiraceae bacterium]|nr:hypothetical protein [Saprospiraceae bacterium]
MNQLYRFVQNQRSNFRNLTSGSTNFKSYSAALIILGLSGLLYVAAQGSLQSMWKFPSKSETKETVAEKPETVESVKSAALVSAVEVSPVEAGAMMPPPNSGWDYSCADGVTVELIGKGMDGQTTASLTIPNSATVDSILVVAITKQGTPPANVTFSTNNGQSATVAGETSANSPNGNSCTNCKMYSTVFSGASTVSVNTNGGTTFPSFSAYIFRTDPGANTSASAYPINMYFYKGSDTFTVPIATDSYPRNVTLEIPISELLNDGRSAIVTMTAGALSTSKSYLTWDPLLGNSLRIGEITLYNVPGTVSSIDVEVKSPTFNGDSFIVGGYLSVTTECETSVTYDYGDAPTLGSLGIKNDGPTKAWLGSEIGDSDPGTQGDPNALGDDNDGNDDEDGVIFIGGTSMVPGQTKTIDIEWNTQDGYSCIYACVDWNHDGILSTSEEIFSPTTVGNGTNSSNGVFKKTFTVPSNAVCGTTFARFYIHDNCDVPPTGLFDNAEGEVEDYAITINSKVIASVSSSPKTICENSSATLTASGSSGVPPYTYEWDNGLPGGPIQTVSPTQTTTYSVTVTDANQCSKSKSYTLVVKDSPEVTVNSATICGGESATLTASVTGGVQPYNYSWSVGSGNSSITVSPNTTTTYSVTVIDNQSCTSEAFATVTVAEMDPAIITTSCDNMGTPTNPLDDVFYYTITVNGNGSTFDISGDDSETGLAYNTAHGPFGPFLITQGNVYLTITDSNNGSCSQSATIVPPSACSNNCVLNFPDISTSCDDNGTPSDDSDDQFYYSIIATANNGGSTFNISGDDVHNGLTYGVIHGPFGPFPTSGGGLVINLTDGSSSSCVLNGVDIMTPNCALCSDVVFEWEGSAANGAVWNPTDNSKVYPINYTDVNGNPASVNVTMTIIDPSNRNYDPDLHTTHPFDSGDGCLPYGSEIDQIPGDGTIIDPWDSDCGTIYTETDGGYGEDYLTFGIKTKDHNEEVTIRFTFSEPIQLNNFTISDIDYVGLYNDYQTLSQYESPGNSYQDEVEVAASNAGGNVPVYFSNIGSALNTSGQTVEAKYNTNFNGNVLPTDPVATLMLNTDESITQLDIIYSNGPDDAADEQIHPNYYSWWSDTHGATNGVSDDHAIRISGFDFCVLTCNLNAPLIAIYCDDNGTPVNPFDDTYTYRIKVTGSNTGANYNISGDDTHASLPYNVVNGPFGPFPISGGALNLMVTDNSDSGCNLSTTVNPPAPCSVLCDLDTPTIETYCNDNGTPTDPSDDYYTYTVFVTGYNTGPSYSITGDDFHLGLPYNVINGPFGNFPISDGDLSITISDLFSISCSLNEIVEAPAVCSTDCDLSVNAGPDVTVCIGDEVTLTAVHAGGNGNVTYQWDNGLGSGASHTFTPNATITYTVTVTDANGCTDTDEVTVTLAAEPLVYIDCGDGGLALHTISPNQNAGCTPASYAFYTSSGIFAPSAGCSTGSYWVTEGTSTFRENANGTAFLSMTVKNTCNANWKLQIETVFSSRTFSPPASSPHEDGCLGDQDNSNWYYYSDTKGNITGLGDLAGFKGSFVRTGPSFQLGNGANLRDGLFGGSGWLDLSIVSQPTGSVTANPGQLDYNFRLSGEALLPEDEENTCLEICAGESATLTANGSGGTGTLSYNWSSGQSGPEITVSPVTTTTYTVTITDVNGCSSTDEATVTVFDAITATASTDKTICLGENTTISASGSGGDAPYSYEWDNGLGSGSSHVVSPSTTTTYSVTVTDSNGCTDTDEVTITVKEIDAPIIVATCNNNGTPTDPSDDYFTYTIEVSGTNTSTTYNISGDDSHTGLSYGVINGPFGNFPISGGDLDITIADSAAPNCAVDATVEAPAVCSTDCDLSVNAGPDVSVCIGDEVTLTASHTGGNGTITYQWDNGLGSGASHTFTPTATTTYTVTVTDVNGCTDTDEVTVTLAPEPLVYIDCGDGGLALHTISPNQSAGCSPASYAFYT